MPGENRPSTGQNPTGRREVLAALGTTGLGALGGCLGSLTSGDDTLRAVWFYVGEVGDLGWSWTHDLARWTLDDRLDWLETSHEALVGTETFFDNAKAYIDDGYDLVFGTSADHVDPMRSLAESHPDVAFEQSASATTRDNLGAYFGRMYQPRYLSGMAAGLATSTDRLGFVAAFEVPEIIRGINAFTLGARAVNDDVTVDVRYTENWYNPELDRKRTRELLASDADVIAQHSDSTRPVETAARHGAWTIGYHASMADFGGRTYLTAPIWDWSVYYEPTVRAVREGSWQGDFFWGGLGDGIIDLDGWGPRVPRETKDLVDSAKEKLLDGSLDIWADTKFEGADDLTLFQEMDGYVDGVEVSSVQE